ncbi:MAG: chromate transporter [Coriobacteriales bacterium]|nr:chromate transporter [Coriobacteriales bacterium]
MVHNTRNTEGLLGRLWALFVATLTISATANSGYAIIAVMRDDFVNKRKWFTEEEMNDYIAIVQSCPGPMAVTSSMVVGYQSAGFLGSLAAVLGVITPPFAVMVLVSVFYQAIVGNPYVAIFMRGMQMGVVAMLLEVCIGLFLDATKKPGAYPLAIMVLAFLYVRLTGCSIMWLAIGCGVAGAVKALLVGRKVSVAEGVAEKGDADKSGSKGGDAS